jgi:hypothetical protein
MLYSTRTPENRQLKKYICKYLKEVPISSSKLQGTVSVYNIRFYSQVIEIEIVFKGKMFAKKSHSPSKWYSSELLNDERVSKIRINKHIKKNLFNLLQSRLHLFDLELYSYRYIKKLKWN